MHRDRDTVSNCMLCSCFLKLSHLSTERLLSSISAVLLWLQGSMLYTNVTRIKDFFLLGFPGLLPEYYGPVSALLFLLFLTIALGNVFILVFVRCVRSLHKPSYLIFCHLALSDLMFGTVTLPRVVSKYWFNDNIVSFYSCFAQMYFVHFLGATHSFILMVMALDRFIAICAPLRYTTLFTNNTASVLCGMSWLLPGSWMFSVVFEAMKIPFCNSNIIVQCYCDHLSIINLGCENVRQSTVLGLGLAMFSLLVPLGFIIISYFLIIVSVLRISSSEGRSRTLSTCTPQLLITALYYTPRCFVYLANFVGYTFSVSIRIVVIMLYSLLPAAVNPIIYCFKTKDIKENFKRKFFTKKVSCSEKNTLKRENIAKWGSHYVIIIIITIRMMMNIIIVIYFLPHFYCYNVKVLSALGAFKYVGDDSKYFQMYFQILQLSINNYIFIHFSLFSLSQFCPSSCFIQLFWNVCSVSILQQLIVTLF